MINMSTATKRIATSVNHPCELRPSHLGRGRERITGSRGANPELPIKFTYGQTQEKGDKSIKRGEQHLAISAQGNLGRSPHVSEAM